MLEGWMSPTQPCSVGMPKAGGNPLPEADMWGAGSIDENSDIHIINDLRLPMAFRLIPRDKAPPYPRQQSGHAPYAPQCGTPWALA